MIGMTSHSLAVDIFSERKHSFISKLETIKISKNSRGNNFDSNPTSTTTDSTSSISVNPFIHYN